MESQAPIAGEASEPAPDEIAPDHGARAAATQEEDSDDLRHRLADIYSQSEEALGTFRDQSRAINDAAVSFIRQRPVVALGVALGVGYVIGRLARSRMII